jgi:hypothetical protein
LIDLIDLIDLIRRGVQQQPFQPQPLPYRVRGLDSDDVHSFDPNQISETEEERLAKELQRARVSC